MKICVFGAGAVGSYLAVLLSGRPENAVSVVARGPHLQAIRSGGLELQTPGEPDRQARLAAATDRPGDLEPQDVIFATLKAQALPGAAANLAALLKPDGHVVCVNNGIPWWWNHGLPAEQCAESRVDPGGSLWRHLGPQRALGCVIYSANEIVAPGKVLHRANNSWLVGEPDRSLSPRLLRTVAFMQAAGLGAQASADLREQVWLKLARNAAFNPLCALTRLDGDALGDEPALLRLAAEITDEVVAVGRAMGWSLAGMDGAGLLKSRKTGTGVKPSMLQDVLAGRSLEVEAILGQVQEFARKARVRTPNLDVIYPLLRGLDAEIRQRQVEPGRWTEQQVVR